MSLLWGVSVAQWLSRRDLEPGKIQVPRVRIPPGTEREKKIGNARALRSHDLSVAWSPEGVRS